eukprot:GHRR01034071.1.p1 GENE.GHRR01034071.1~~GHRR01034071.1.p1  ORF type:complete len:165 (+),score=46.30 GHRR01034071.1:223-717(+)
MEPYSVFWHLLYPVSVNHNLCPVPCQLPPSPAAVTNRRLWVSESGLPPLPYTAPFTSSVPQVLGLVRRFVSDSLAYLRGLLSAGELLPAVLQHRDRMLSKVVNDVLSAKARSIGSNEEMMREAMRCAANAWALSYAMDGLDDWTIHQARPGTETAAQVYHCCSS